MQTQHSIACFLPVQEIGGCLGNRVGTDLSQCRHIHAQDGGTAKGDAPGLPWGSLMRQKMTKMTKMTASWTLHELEVGRFSRISSFQV